MRDSCFLPARTFVGKGELLNLPSRVDCLGNGIIVHGQSFWKKKEYKLLQSRLRIKKSFYQYKGGEPCLQDVRELIAYCRSKKATWIAGIGGGSVLDLAKAAAGLYFTGEDPVYYHRGGALTKRGIPFIAIPTTTGSGSEATIISVLINEETQEKLSLRDSNFMAHTVILDPDLLLSLSPVSGLYSAMDALTHAIESYFSINADWLTETLALQGFKLLTKNLKEFRNLLIQKAEQSTSVHSEMLLGSYYIGMAFTNSGLGIVHGMAMVVGSVCKLPHGQVCAGLLVPAIKLNKPYVEGKYSILSDILGEDLLGFIKSLNYTDCISESTSKLSPAEVKIIIDSSLKSGSTACNPKPIVADDVREMLGLE